MPENQTERQQIEDLDLMIFQAATQAQALADAAVGRVAQRLGHVAGELRITRSTLRGVRLPADIRAKP